jgi:hypothetical protein
VLGSLPSVGIASVSSRIVSMDECYHESDTLGVRLPVVLRRGN